MSLAPSRRLVGPPNIKQLTVRRDTICGCGIAIDEGTQAGWDRSAFVLRCMACVADAESAALETLFSQSKVDVGMQRWVAEHEVRLRDRLAAHAHDLDVLRDRRIMRSRNTIEHLIVGRAGVFVLSAKSYANARVDLRHTGGLFVPSRNRLVVGDRDKSALIDAINRQISGVLNALGQHDDFLDVPVQALLCITDGVFPWIGTIDVDGVRVRNLHATIKAVNAEGPYDHESRQRIVRQLAKHLPPTR